MLADLRFHLSRLLISSCVFSRSGGTETELADLEPGLSRRRSASCPRAGTGELAQLRHARSSRTAILRGKAGFHVRLHRDWKGHVTRSDESVEES